MASAFQQTAKVVHRNRHMFFYSALGDAEAFRDFCVAKTVELVHAKHSLRSGRHLSDRMGKPLHFLTFNQSLLGSACRIRNFGGWMVTAELIGSPVMLATLAATCFPDPVECQIVCHSEQVGFGIGYRAGCAARHPDPQFAQQVICFCLAAHSGDEKSPKFRAEPLKLEEQSLRIGAEHLMTGPKTLTIASR